MNADPSPGRESLRVLVVEDDALVRQSFRDLLESLGYLVEPVSTGGAALDAADRRTPDLVLMDVGLPDMDGIECALKLRQHRIESPLVFLTAYGRHDFVARALVANPAAYLVKPISGEQLVPVVRTALHTSAAERAREERMVAALSDSRQISAAVGMLAERYRWSVEEAFAAMRLTARSERRTLLEIAAEITNRNR